MRDSKLYAEINQAISKMEELEAEQSELENGQETLENEIDRLTNNIPMAESQYADAVDRNDLAEAKKWVARKNRWEEQCRKKKKKLECVNERLDELETERYEPLKQLTPDAKEFLRSRLDV